MKFEGKEIIRSSDLPHHVGRVKPGKTARVAIMRAGRSETIKVKIGTLPSQNELAQGHSPQKKESQANRLNVQVAELDQKRKDKWQVSKGVVVKTYHARSRLLKQV